MRQIVSETLEVSHLELLCRGSTYGDQEAWEAFQESLEETLLTWLHKHPAYKVVCSIQSDHHFIALAFERLWQAVVQRQIVCETFSKVFLYLRASLNGVILDALRVSSGPRGVSSSRPDAEEHLGKNEVWDRLQALLSGVRERRLAYLLYQCRLDPVEVVRSCPQEWSDVHEVARLRRIILERFMHRPNCESK